LLWTTNLVEKDLHLLDTLKKVGYDGVEIPIFEGEVDHFYKIGQAIKNSGLESTSVTVITNKNYNPISPNLADRESNRTHKMGNRL